MFIDATYEGDLMAKAGVLVHGRPREANSQYGETLNGVQLGSQAASVQACRSIPTSSRATRPAACCRAFTPARPGEHGQGDKRVQAYNFRMCMTDDAGQPAALAQAGRLRPAALRTAAALHPGRRRSTCWATTSRCQTARPTRTTTARFSTDNIGMNYDYPDGDYATREQIWKNTSPISKG